MQVRTSRSKPKWGTRKIVRLATLLWGMGLGICFCSLILQYSSLRSTTPPSESGSAYSYHRSTGSLERLATVEAVRNDHESPAQRAIREQAARESHAWTVRKFLLDSQESSFKKNFTENRAESGLRLPKWMAVDAEKRAHFRASDWDDFATGEEEYDSCNNFNHTVLRPTHGCQVNPDTRQVYCVFSNLRIDNTRILMDQGGEPLDKVMGRNEEAELPKYKKGAFSTRPKPNFEVPPAYRQGLHFIEDVLNNLKYPTTKNQGKFDSSCVETRDGTTLMITRYEYVNLYHTLTDWWNAFSVLTPEQKARRERIRILFLDGHAQGNLDSVWENVFGPSEYVQHLPPKGVCFERAVFIPPGYSAPIFPDLGKGEIPPRLRCPRPRIASDFAKFFLTAYDLQQVKPIPCKVVIIDRQPYVSHPRSNPDTFGRKMNMEKLAELLHSKSKASSVEVVRFETMKFSEQIRKSREAQILIGNHGAGLSQLMFMDTTSHILEFSFDTKDFFVYLAEWTGIHHMSIEVASENLLDEADLARTVDMVNSLLSST